MIDFVFKRKNSPSIRRKSTYVQNNATGLRQKSIPTKRNEITNKQIQIVCDYSVAA